MNKLSTISDNLIDKISNHNKSWPNLPTTQARLTLKDNTKQKMDYLISMCLKLSPSMDKALKRDTHHLNCALYQLPNFVDDLTSNNVQKEKQNLQKLETWFSWLWLCKKYNWKLEIFLLISLRIYLQLLGSVTRTGV